jgi:hypothetical protein
VGAIRWLSRHVADLIVGSILTIVGIFISKKLPVRLGEHAVIGWIDERLAEILGLSAPSLTAVIDFTWNYCVPPLFVLLILWAYHLYNNRALNSENGKRKLLGLALIAVGIIALISGASLLASAPEKTANPADDSTTKAETALHDLSGQRERVERDLAAKSSELAATKQELEVTKRALANAQSPVPNPPPPPDRNIADLNGNEKRALVLALNSDVRPIAPSVFITRSTVAPYSHDLGTMTNLFEGAGIRAATGVQSPDGPSQTGLMIGVSDTNAPPAAAQRIKELFARYGISSTYYLLQNGIPNSGGFNIFIGSKAW